MATVAEKNEDDALLPAAKPPFLRRVRIQGYKSIAFCDVTLEPLTILVGRNASGKSNFVDALAFLRDVIDKGVNAALEAHGGSAVFSKTEKANKIVFEIEAEFPGHQMWCRATYRLELALARQEAHGPPSLIISPGPGDPPTKFAGFLNQVTIEQEILQIEDVTHNKQCGYTANRGKIIWNGLNDFGAWGFGPRSTSDSVEEAAANGVPWFFDRFRADRPILGVVGNPPFGYFSQELSSIGCFNFNPDSMRELQSTTGWPGLKRDGRNLARAIEGLKEISEEDLARVQAYLTAIVPEIIGFDVVQLGDYETVRFRICRSLEAEPLEFNASSMSDGTLRVLATLVAAFQILLPPVFGFIAIEEPETSLHPDAMRALVDALDEATLRKQILLTTHSAEMLDNPTIRPENIRVVEMIDGKTVIATLDEASVEIVQRKLNSLGELERGKQLEPNLDDMERQQGLAKAAQESAT